MRTAPQEAEPRGLLACALPVVVVVVVVVVVAVVVAVVVVVVADEAVRASCVEKCERGN